MDLMEATNNLEAIGDLIETNLVGLGRDRLANDYTVGPESRELITEFHEMVVDGFDRSVTALTDASKQDAKRVGRMKNDINAKADEIALHYTNRLTAPDADRIELYRFETDVVANLKRIFYFARRTARAAIPTAEQASS